MNWMNQIGGILQQYAGTAAAQAPDTVENDFDQLAENAPRSAVADGLAAAFRSDQTPAFGQMAAQLFQRSNGQQRANMLNTLIAQFLNNRNSGGWSSGQQITPEQAEQISPEEVHNLAAEAEKRDPSIID